MLIYLPGMYENSSSMIKITSLLEVFFVIAPLSVYYFISCLFLFIKF